MQAFTKEKRKPNTDTISKMFTYINILCKFQRFFELICVKNYIYTMKSNAA